MASAALTLGLLLASLVALLAVPVTVAFSIHRIGETRGEFRFRWLFGLVRFRIRIPRAAGARPRSATVRRRTAGSPGQRRKKGRAGKLLSLAGQTALRRRVFKFIRDILRATHARELFVRMRIGLGDPADTGRLWAVVGPLAVVAQTLRGAAVHIEPEFMDAVIEVESHGRFRLVPIQFLALTATFLLSPTMLRAWWRLRRGNA